MSVSDYLRVKEFFLAAIELEPGERQQFVSQIADGATRNEVASLLSAREESRKFLDDVSAVDAFGGRPAGNERHVGKLIGKYRILREIGHGGMGVVYLAAREDFRQKNVALKLIKSGADSAGVQARFMVERQILASLEHPNVARLLDGGNTDDGTPFFVMEYVEGEPIDEYCRTNELSVTECLLLFRKICAAVSHAHRNLVIHRDLKSSNILVTADGEPKLLDFGIAKLFSPDSVHDETTNMRALTPEYASPEQFRGEKLTTATDVYSLGVVLYELLSGSRPIQCAGRNYAEVLKAVCEQTPTRPSVAVTDGGHNENTGEILDRTSVDRRTRMRRLRGDLDNIILKALRKEPERRYGSVEEFAADVQRHIDGLPVSARPDTFSYRTEKFLRRNRVAAAISAILVVILLSGVFTTLTQARRADRERSRAEQRFRDVRELANTLLTEFPDAVDKSATKGKELLVRHSLKYLDNLAADAEADPGLQRELAAAYIKVGNLQGNEYYPNLGDSPGAMKSYRVSLDLRNAVLQIDEKDMAVRSEVAESYERIGDMAWTMDDLPGAQDNYQRALAFREQIVAETPDSTARRSELANAYWKLADLLGNDVFANLGDTESSLEMHRRALAIRRSLVDEDPANTGFQDELLSSYTNMANVMRIRGDNIGAEQSYRRGLSLSQELLAKDPTNKSYKDGVALSCLYLGTLLAEEEKYDEAISNYSVALEFAENTGRADPEDVKAQLNIAAVQRRLGLAIGGKGDVRGSLEHFRRSLSILERQGASDPGNLSVQSSLSMTYAQIGDALAQEKHAGDALTNYRSALAIRTRISGNNLSDKKSTHELANIYVRIGDLLVASDTREALQKYDLALQLLKQFVDEDRGNIKARRQLADLYAKIAYANGTVASSQTRSSTTRRDKLMSALDFYQLSLEIWTRLRDDQILTARESDHIAEIEKQMTRFRALT